MTPRHNTEGIPTESSVVIRRAWAMPSGDTFSIKPVAEMLGRWLQSHWTVIDPFSRNSTWGTITNDLNPKTQATYHLDAREFLKLQSPCDAILLDPPYSPRQIKDCYESVGMPVGKCETQHARLIAECKDLATSLVRPGGIAVTCGWNSSGFGKGRGFARREILLVNHGGSHNDTVIVVEEKLPELFDACLPPSTPPKER